MRPVIEGHRLRLRYVTPDDAAFIHGLRTDPTYNTHLSPVSGTVEDQRRWIESYKIRESSGQEFYFVIERKDRIPCGAVRIYDINAESFTWGSWILDHNKPAKAALESALLSFDAGFETLGTATALIDVRRLNTRAEAFYRRFGAIQIGNDFENLYFELPRDVFQANRQTFFKTIEAQE